MNPSPTKSGADHAVIMAGGEGTRLRPFTHTIPKPLLPIGRKPIAQIIVERLRDCGITEIIMSIGYAADLIRAYFQNGSQFGVSITYYQEPERLGTAGCLAHLPQLRERPFLVTNGDILTDLNYYDFLSEHTGSKASMSVATRTQAMPIPYGVLTVHKGLVQTVQEKPVYDYCFNAGIYALSPEAIDHVPQKSRTDMTDLINTLLGRKLPVRAVPIEGIWYDLARVDDFDRALTEIEKSNPELL